MEVERTTTISVYVRDVEIMKTLMRPREVVPEKKPGRGRGYSYLETYADIVSRAMSDLAQKENDV